MGPKRPIRSPRMFVAPAVLSSVLPLVELVFSRAASELDSDLIPHVESL